MTTTADLKTERLDELERLSRKHPSEAWVQISEYSALIDMARRTEQAEREQDEWREKWRDAVTEMAHHIDRAHDLEVERDALAEHAEHCFKQHDCWPSVDVVRILNRLREAALAQPTTEGGE